MSNTFLPLSRQNYTSSFIDSTRFYYSSAFNAQCTYDNDDLGILYTPSHCTFKVWAPLATDVRLNIYTTDDATHPLFVYSLNPSITGVWSLTYNGNLKDLYYTYHVTNFDSTYEVVDPYARAVGANGLRGMIIDFTETNPSGWAYDTYVTPNNPTDAILYELHVRDFSIAPSADSTYPGKYLAFTEHNRTNAEGHLTGLSHIKELGITHIHLLPVYDFNSIDETSSTPAFNWGYDPLHYNTLEGSYATNAHDGKVRIKEFKQMVQSIHNMGIGVVMDVVYNHTACTEDSFLNQLVPHYYHRCTKTGTFGNASDCGNEIASERPMVRKMIVDSLVFWAKEYHIDGFRFDLMGILDIETMNAIRTALDAINPNIIIYGEGWYASTPLLPKSELAIKNHAPLLHPHIACFNDDFRDAVKGHVFEHDAKGYINGNFEVINSVKFGIVGATSHPQIDYNDVIYTNLPWAKEPSQCINYVSAHDNLTLFDKLQITLAQHPIAHQITINKMAAALVLTSQGIPFIHAGEELLRSKPLANGFFDENSYISPDSVNQIDWSRKTTYLDVFHYYQGLIKLRKTHPAFRMTSTIQIQQHLRFLSLPDEGVLGYELLNAPSDSWQWIILLFNPTPTTTTLKLPSDHWGIVTNEVHSGIDVLASITTGETTLPPFSLQILVHQDYL